MNRDFEFNDLAKILRLPRNSRPFVKELFVQALTHKSFLQDTNNSEEKALIAPNHYDRLEFLGDSVLKLVMNENLYRQYGLYDSGELTKLSAYLLSDKTLKRIGQKLQIVDYIRTGTRIKPEAVLPDIMESLIGASYLAYGFDITGEFIIELYKEIIQEADASELKDNYKAALQELTQSQQLGLPEYTVAKAEGPAHSPKFEIEVSLNGVSLGKGTGSSKKEASQMAAEQALAKLNTK